MHHFLSFTGSFSPTSKCPSVAARQGMFSFYLQLVLSYRLCFQTQKMIFDVWLHSLTGTTGYWIISISRCLVCASYVYDKLYLLDEGHNGIEISNINIMREFSK